MARQRNALCRSRVRTQCDTRFMPGGGSAAQNASFVTEETQGTRKLRLAFLFLKRRPL